MRHVRRYIVLALIAILACILKFHSFGRDYETVEQFRGAKLLKEDWNPLIAETVNEKRITVAIDNKEFTNQETSIFMDNNLNIMVPVDILPEGLKCSSHLYEGKELLV